MTATIGQRAVGQRPSVTDHHLGLADEVLAHNYAPLPVVLASGDGAWVTDVEGRRYLDFLAGYSALNFGHRHPALVAAAHRQLDTLTLVSRAFHHDQLGPFAAELGALVGPHLRGTPMVLPMNTGAEAVETALKVSRAWGYRVKGVPEGRANVVVMSGNFHGRTTTIVGFSDDPSARDGFGPFTPGFRIAPYGDADAVADLVDEHTVAVLVEPVQGEAGVIVPPAGFLASLRATCDRAGALLVADEVQSGLGRAGATLACELAGAAPDLVALGKALGGGIMPVSAVVGDAAVLGVLRPGEHGSTFGGGPLACAVGREVVAQLATGAWQQRAAELGAHLRDRLTALADRGVTDVRAVGLWAGVDVDPDLASGKAVCRALAGRGVLAKETHGSTVRLSPPLVVTPDELDWAVDQLAAALVELAATP